MRNAITRQGSRSLITGLLLLVLMLAGCPMPETGEGPEMLTAGDDGSRATTAYVPYVPVKQVACGETYSMILKTDGTLWGSGSGDGQYDVLGTGDTITRYNLVRVLTGVKEIDCGPYFTMALKSDGTLWATGDNRYGQLGTGDTVNRFGFVRVASRVKSVACGGSHTLIAKTDGTLLTAGANLYGQLGNGSTNPSTSFIRISGMYNVKKVVCGTYNSFALKTDNTLWAAGIRYGTGDDNNKMFFDYVQGDVRTLACGGNFTLVVKNDSTLWGSGVNWCGQLGTNDAENKTAFVEIMGDVKTVGCGALHSFAIKNDNSLWVTGENDEGQHGTGHDWGEGGRGTFEQVMNNVASADGGVWHSLAIKTDGTFWCTGDNSMGQLGMGSNTIKFVYFQKKIALRSFQNNLYVCANLNEHEDGPLYAMSSQVGLWETFGLNDISYEYGAENMYAIHSYATNQCINAYPGMRASPCIPFPGGWLTDTEKFLVYFKSPADRIKAYSYSLVLLKAVFADRYLNNISFDPDQSSPGMSSYFYMHNVF
ncbi:MAG: hypothetical protein EHM28_06125 [Spirochaetaceae bacterium]|nr:MAG: hypothetical protein EHM28_06125 [Spirochaetaceae bacterium]